MCGSRETRRPVLQPRAATTPALLPNAPGRGGAALRIGDAERDASVALLSGAYAEGYLDRSELDVRAGRALTATTSAELDALRADLPGNLQPAQAPAVQPRRGPSVPATRGQVTSYVSGVALMLGIWLVTAVVFGATYFWPVWPILGWGIAVVSHLRLEPGRPGQAGPA